MNPTTLATEILGANNNFATYNVTSTKGNKQNVKHMIALKFRRHMINIFWKWISSGSTRDYCCRKGIHKQGLFLTHKGQN